MSDKVIFQIDQHIDLAGANPPLTYEQPLVGGDKAAHEWRVHVRRGTEKVALHGYTVNAYVRRDIRRDDGAEEPMLLVKGGVSENMCIAEFPVDVYKMNSPLVAVMRVANAAGSTIAMAVMRATSENILSGSVYDPDGKIVSLDELLAQINEMEKATADGKAAAAEARAAAQTATSAANTAVGNANTAAARANNAAVSAENAAAGANAWANASMTAKVLPAGSAPTVSLTKNNSGNYVIALGVPKGDTGATPQIRVEVSTGAAGTDAQVSVSGTAEEPIIHLTIPRGEVGAIENLTINGKPVESGTIRLTAEDVGALAKNDTAADSNKLDGKDASYYYCGAPNYTYDGRDLSTFFASLGELHDAVAAGDFSQIRVGDYWPITLNGSFKDYATGEIKNLANATFRMEVAPQVYLGYGDTPVPNHLLMCSRDLIPMSLMCRSEASTWYDKDATNPWTGSHLYQTLNAADGILPLVEAIFGSYMYAGPNGKGMRFRFEAKGPGATAATGLVWGDRGKLFLPTEREVWGQDVRSEHTYGAGAAVQWPMFIGTLRHIMKSLGNGASPYYWWVQSSADGSATDIGYVAYTGYPLSGAASNTWMSAPLCFLFV